MGKTLRTVEPTLPGLERFEVCDRERPFPMPSVRELHLYTDWERYALGGLKTVAGSPLVVLPVPTRIFEQARADGATTLAIHDGRGTVYRAGIGLLLQMGWPIQHPATGEFVLTLAVGHFTKDTEEVETDEQSA